MTRSTIVRVSDKTFVQTFKLLLEYEGTRYSGWQKQINARTVQGELNKACETVFKAKIETGGAGRTDAGVHALQQVAHLRANTNQRFQPKQLRRDINDLLPHDISVLKIEIAPPRFHARHDAIARYYLYQIATRRTAFGKNSVWWIKDELDAAAMAAAAQTLIGRHDFASFSERDAQQTSTVVQVDNAEIAVFESLILFRIGASHFLWKMVRRIVGVLAEVGRGNLSPNNFQKLLKTHSNALAALTAPPSGLFLEQILYAGDKPKTALEPAFAAMFKRF